MSKPTIEELREYLHWIVAWAKSGLSEFEEKEKMPKNRKVIEDALTELGELRKYREESQQILFDSGKFAGELSAKLEKAKGYIARINQENFLCSLCRTCREHTRLLDEALKAIEYEDE